MKIITCASYYGSGSSALTDLVSEYDNVKDLSDFEFRFLHDLDGVRDLEYHLVDNHNRHNSGHAIKRFARLSQFNEGNIFSKRYSQFFEKDDYHRITSEYISELTDFSYPGWWFYDLYDKGTRKYYLYQFLNHAFKRFTKGKLKILKNEKIINSHPTYDDFLSATRSYVSKLMRALNKENFQYLEIDQIVPSSNIDRVLPYFEDEIFVFVVDRDPRDVYLLGKYHWKSRICPTDPNLFCKWFRYARESGSGVPNETSHVIRLKFEDIVYRYDETVKRIETITGLSAESHTKQYSKMNPKRSVANTRLWEKYSDDEGIKMIEELLPDYLYDYTGIDVSDVKGIEVKNPSNF